MAIYTNKWDYRRKLKTVDQWDIHPSEKAMLKEYAHEYASGRITGRIGKNIDASVEDSLSKLKLPLTFMKKSIDEITEEDLRRFVDSLLHDKIKKKVRRKVEGELRWCEIGNYEKKGKDKFLKNLALYLKFRLEGEPEKLGRFLKVVKVIITHVNREPESLGYDDFEKVYEACSSLSDRYYLLVNVWGGFRASEFHGIRTCDIHLPRLEEGEEFVRMWIRYANSKTKGRMVTLYGNDCYRIVQAYLQNRELEGLGHEDLVYEKTHNSRKTWLRRLGKRFSLHLYPHLFRSTCATWLVDKAILKSYADLTEFFGWSYGSPVPNLYLNRSGIQFQRLDDNVKKTRLEELRMEVEKQREINETQKCASEARRVAQEKRIEELEGGRERVAALVKKLTDRIDQLQERIAEKEAV